jgi:hypothetical protein
MIASMAGIQLLHLQLNFALDGQQVPIAAICTATVAIRPD